MSERITTEDILLWLRNLLRVAEKDAKDQKPGAAYSVMMIETIIDRLFIEDYEGEI